MRLGKLKFRISDRRSSGFTLMELMTVMVIIAMLIGVAALAFNTLTGRRSTSMARNQIGAMLGQMRGMAMNDASANPNLYGVMFYYDPNVDRSVMQPVIVTGMSDPDPNDQLKGWVAANNPNYQVGDRVVAITNVRNTVVTNDNRPAAIRFRCVQQPSANPLTYPPTWVDLDSGTSSNSNYWVVQYDQATGVDFADMAAEQLPAGVGVQLLTDVSTMPTLGPVAMGLGPERYLETGLILFDNTGKLAIVYYSPTAPSAIQRRVQASGNPALAIHSQIGLNIFDREKFTSASQTAAGAALTPSDADYAFQVFGQAQPSAANERNEEQWLDENGTLVIVDRLSGELKDVRK